MTLGGDAFAPLNGAGSNHLGSARGAIIMPSPIEPPAASSIQHRQHGVGVARWIYRDAARQPLICVVRFQPPAQGDAPARKVVLPQSFMRDANGEGWRFGAPEDHRPLYGLDRLSAAGAKGVLVVEGEKTCDAAAARFPALVAVTSQGGALAAAKSDWSALAGRDVTIWPDQDEPGRQYAADVQRLLGGVARTVRIVDVPRTWPDGWDLADDLPPGVSIEAVSAMVSKPPGGLEWIDPHTLQGKAIQPREWIVQDWLPVGCATLLFGDGGVGKTLLVQQLMTSCATAKAWCGLAVMRCGVLGVFCEDDTIELQRRQDRINDAYGIQFDDLDEMSYASGVGQDNVLMRFAPDGRPLRMERLAVIRDRAISIRARLIVLDTAADLFGGNENDRAQVRAFMGALNGLAMEIGGAVLLNAHPSRSGLGKDGDMDGGSTAWSNTARSRWSLARPKADDDAEPDADGRVLTRRKANYSSIGETIKLRWSAGALVAPDRPPSFAAMASHADADAVFLALLGRCDDGNMPLSQSDRAHNFAPKVFANRPDRQGLGRRDFEGAMNRLLATKKIVLVNYGRKGDERRKLALTCAPNA